MKCSKCGKELDTMYLYIEELVCEECMRFQNETHKNKYEDKKITESNKHKFIKIMKNKIKQNNEILNCVLNDYGFENPNKIKISKNRKRLLEDIKLYIDEIDIWENILEQLSK